MPVEYSSAGGLFMYRLFEAYPKDKLHIVQTRQSDESSKLKEVHYTIMSRDVIYRIKKTRFHRFAEIIDFFSNLFITKKIHNLVKVYKPEAILTVTHRLNWMMAYKTAKKYKLPLHLILHDDFLYLDYHHFIFKTIITKIFYRAYAFAKSRNCISTAMEQQYFTYTNVHGSILYPFPGKYDRQYTSEDIVFTEKKQLNFCYAGSMYVGGYREMLNLLAKVLLDLGHTLTIFATIEEEELKNYAHLTKSHVNLLPYVERKETIQYQLQKSDVNVLLNSFMFENLFAVNFSSKLADYGLAPVPILFWGADSSCLIQTMKKNKYAGVLMSVQEDAIKQAVQKYESVEYRKMLSKDVYIMATTTFSYTKNYNKFLDSLYN